MATQPFALAYRIYFTWMDPIISLITTAVFLLNRDLILTSFNPALVPRDTRYDVLLDMIAGCFALIAIQQGVLLRCSNEVNVWKAANAGVLMVDFAILGTMVNMHFLQQGATGVATFRVDDVMNYLLTVVAVVMRVGCIAGVGLTEQSKTRATKKRQ